MGHVDRRLVVRVVPAVLAVACAAIALSSAPTLVRAPAALLLAVYLPGAGVMAAVFPSERANIEKTVLSVALSVALAILLGLVLNFGQKLSPSGWAIGLATIAVLGHAISCRVPAPSSTRSKTLLLRALTPLEAGGLCLAGIVAGGAVIAAGHGANSQHEFAYTDFWMVPGKVDHPSFATVGVRDEEGKDADYRIEIVARGALVDRFPSFRLRSGEQRTFMIAMPDVIFSKASDGAPLSDSAPKTKPSPTPDPASAVRIEARLYKDGDRTAVYRDVWAALPPAVSPSSPERSAATDQPGASEE